MSYSNLCSVHEKQQESLSDSTEKKLLYLLHLNQTEDALQAAVVLAKLRGACKLATSAHPHPLTLMLYNCDGNKPKGSCDN